MVQRGFVFLGLLSFALGAETEDPLQTLRREHPRLVALDEDMARIRRLVKQQPEAAEIYRRLREEAEKLETAPTVEYKLVGPRLLAQSRACLRRVYTLALLYRLDGAKSYLDRAIRELRAAADFPDWNPSHFLDTAEMTHAFAIGYDWLYPALSPDQRAWMRQAIVEKGLDQALMVYRRERGWHLVTHNWNQVCNGGIGLGALAVAEDAPDKARDVVRRAVASLPLAMGSYAPDGGWAEGPGYWHYATMYNVYFLAGLETALGMDFGLSKMKGFERAGHFRVYTAGPAAKTFNYADAGDGVGGAAEMFWLARRFSQPVYAGHQIEQLKKARSADPLDLIWFQGEALSPRQAGWPLDVLFEGVQVAVLRSSWDDPDAIFVGIKGGDNKANHSHLDLGTFVLDAGGVRWALDFGSDNYNLPGYFGPRRWDYYRLRTQSHNVLMMDGENQDPKAAAAVVAHRFTPRRAEVRMDLQRAYPGKLKRHERRLALVDRRRVVITDMVEADAPREALWGMVTDAEVRLDGATAELHKQGRVLRAKIHAPRGARFDIVSTEPPAPQAQNRGTRKLVVRLPRKVARFKLVVSLAPFPAAVR